MMASGLRIQISFKIMDWLADKITIVDDLSNSAPIAPSCQADAT
jgi:hypothetical protein